MKIKSFILFFIFILALVSCQDKPVLPNKVDIYKMTTAIDASFKLILPKDMNSGIKCADYGDDCKSGYTGRVLNLEMIFVEFATINAATLAAQKIDAYVYKNWLFDDVKGEPELERFVKRAYGAVKAREILLK